MAIQFSKAVQEPQKPRKTPEKRPKTVDPTKKQMVDPTKSKVDPTRSGDRHAGKKFQTYLPADLFAAIEADRISRHQTRAEWLRSALEALERNGR